MNQVLKSSNKPRILFFDLETSLSIVTTFGLFNQNISYNNIIDDWFIICASWKWADEDKIHSTQIKRGSKDDKKVVKEMRDAIEEADIIIAHNGDKFDVKKLNTRIIYHGLAPLPKILSIDTLKVARKYFKFTSNRLDYIAQFLGVGAKMDTTKGLWMKVLMGDEGAIDEMVAYNKVDIEVLEAVYYKLKPYMHDHPHLSLFDGRDTDLCPHCQGKNLQRRGYSYTKAGKYQRFQCQDCAAWSQSRTATLTSAVR